MRILDDFSLLMEKIEDFRKWEIPQLLAKTRRRIEEISALEPLIIKLDYENKMPSEKWIVIAIDGGSDFTVLEGVGFAVATARSFTVGLGENAELEGKDFKFFDTPATDLSSIVTTTAMKALEYKVATEVVKSASKKEDINVLVLLDGAITFPDSSVGKTKIKELTKAYNNYVEESTSFFKEVISQPNVNVIAVSKDARRAKYLRGLIADSQNRTISKDKAKFLKNLIEVEGWTERIALQALLRKKASLQPAIMHPVLVSKPNITHGELPIQILKDKGVYATYYLYPGASHALYLELPGKNAENLDELMDIFTFLCRVSPVIGYPFPLVYVDALTRVSKSMSKSLFSQIIVDLKKRAPDIAMDLTASKMRELLH